MNKFGTVSRQDAKPPSFLGKKTLRLGVLARGALNPSRRGVALITVLGVLVLVSALIIAFLASVKTELVTSQSYAYGAGTQQLADSAVSMATALIRDATKGGTASAPLAWASQPGMIRTYGADGRPDTFYKLYSSGSMIVSGAGFRMADETPPADWDAQAGLYVDLNAPVRDKDDRPHFPILDPRAKSAVSGSGIEGFDYWADINGVVEPGGDADSQRLPMPVRWLYVLQDGRIATPASVSGGAVTFSGSNVPTADNPVVGRVAFWTDDDTCKLNINTASEGTFWDRPWANTETEQYFATSIPAQNEFQRFPGHPAKTALSAVFAPLLPSPNTSGTRGPLRLAPASKYASYTQYQPQLAAYYALTPRVGDGGTRGGTVNENDATGNGSPNPDFTPVVMDSDRLYASVDELLYNPARAVSASGTITKEFLEKANFFLTARNRAPELNLFGKPRLALWPLQVNNSERTAKDRLIAFCTTVSGKPYYFQRLNTYTANPHTSAGGSTNASSQSAVKDWSGVARNQELWAYLDNLTAKDIPGFGGSFAAKYPSTKRQILTEMFDMIRSGVNQYSSEYHYTPSFLLPGAGQVIPIKPDSGSAAGTQGFGRTQTLVGAALVFFRANSGTYNMDSGGAYLMTGTGGIISGTQQPDLRTALNPQGIKVTPGAKIGATLFLNPYTPSPGLPPLNPNLQYVVSGFESLKVSGRVNPAMTSLPFDSDPLTNIVSARAEYSGGGNVTPYFGVLSAFRYARTLDDSIGDDQKKQGTNAVTQYPLTTRKDGSLYDGVQLHENDTTFDFSGGTLTVEVYAAADLGRENRLQTIKLRFPPVSGLLVPTSDPHPNRAAILSPPDRGADAYIGLTKFRRMEELFMYFRIPALTKWLGGVNRVRNSLGKTKDGTDVYYWVTDIARGIEASPDSPARGDLRVMAALDTVTEDYFRPCLGYDYTVNSTVSGVPDYKYVNVQSLRDMGADNTSGGYGYDNSPFSYTGDVSAGVDNVFTPGPAPHPDVYPHFTQDHNASANYQFILQISAFADGVLIPRSELQRLDPNRKGLGSLGIDGEYRTGAWPAVANGTPAALNAGNQPGDWDNMTGNIEDGAFINKPDEGNSTTIGNYTHLVSYEDGGHDMSGGYFATGFSRSWAYKVDNAAAPISTYSPNRQVSSAVMFGSLPTGINPADSTNVRPWQTLLFCANPAAGSAHPGFASPPDWLFLDLFTMPVVEPYAISEPFSTAGKVNMNYQLAPFTHIRRSTAVRAVMKTSRLMAIPQSISTITAIRNSYKDGQRCTMELRYNINPDEETGTLKGFENRFADGDLFRSAAEICGINLVPKKMPQEGLSNINMTYPAVDEPNYDSTPAWWNNFKLTGDNTREFPYGDLYARLTTKSNTFTVHVRVQSLKKNSTTDPAQWVEGRDAVVGEYRGSTTVERYIDTNAALPDFATAADSAEAYYKFHVINTKKFQF